MFKGHPKGLYALALANTGERFGYYTMLAIFVLFLQAKFGFTAAQAGQFYGFFLAGVYFMPLIGGILADKFGYGKMVTLGIVVMFLGYLLMAVPASGSVAMVSLIGALVLICVGTGLFKGNLQVMVGNLYDDPRYSAKRDSAFSIFYMAINIGAMYAPSAATAIANWQLKKNGFFYDANIPSLANEFLKNPDTGGDVASKLETLAGAQGWTGSIADFASSYIDALAGSYHMGFAVACFSLVVSMAIYLGFKKTFKHADVTSKQQAAQAAAHGEKVVELTKEQTKQRITALVLVFVVVIFFWMSFHQNGLTLTWFARDYTANSAEGLTRIGFSLPMMTCIVIAMYSLFSIFQSTTKKAKSISAGIFALMIVLCIILYMNLNPSTHIEPQLFQQFNPFFVVLLTPISVALFGALAKKGKEPSTPKKIGMGMLIAACGFLVMALASRGLANPTQINGTSDILVSPNWLISTYLVLTFGELLLSPMGISFVSKVAPPKYKGMMMGFWFAATAVGNYLTSVIANIWESGMQLWMIWGVLIVVCVISAIFIFSILKRLEKATGRLLAFRRHHIERSPDSETFLFAAARKFVIFEESKHGLQPTEEEDAKTDVSRHGYVAGSAHDWMQLRSVPLARQPRQTAAFIGHDRTFRFGTRKATGRRTAAATGPCHVPPSCRRRCPYRHRRRPRLSLPDAARRSKDTGRHPADPRT